MKSNKKTSADEEVQPGTWKAWLLAARPKTLTGAATPVMIGMAMAYADMSEKGNGGMFSIVVAVLCFLFAFIMQIDANFVNDYFDFKKGTDDKETRLGPQRACAQGWISPEAMLRAIFITTCLACLVGLPLILFGGVEMIVIGALCVLFCFLYTTSLSYMGMGDLLVLIFFGIVPICVPYYLQTGDITWQVVLMSLACGLVIDGLLIVNNYRDRDTDFIAGKRTIVVRIGAKATEHLYLGVGVIAYLMGVIVALSGYPWAAVIPLVYLILHIKTWRKLMMINKGKALNACLGDTARNIFVYGLTLSLAVVL